MDIAALRALVAVAEHGSFSRAAEALYLTQPAISKRIGLLEQQVQVQLFERLGRHTRLSAAGQRLLPRARRILRELDDGLRDMQQLSEVVAGTLTIATSHHIGLHRLPPVLRHFAARYPDVSLDMRFVDSEHGCDLVAEGDAELAIVTLPLDPERLALCCTPIWPDPLAVLVSREHPLTCHAPSLDALSQWPAILPGQVTFTRRLIDRVFLEHGLRPRIAFATNYLETIKMMVSVGLGWSVLPASMRDDDLYPLDLPELAMTRTLGVVTHPRHVLSRAATELLALLNRQPS